MKNIQILQNRKFYLIRTSLIVLILIVVYRDSLYAQSKPKIDFDSEITYRKYKPQTNDRLISRSKYLNKMYGFWLGQCIANWTGLVTEMDKIGSIGELKTGAFYTREDWGKPDQPSIWGQGVPSNLSPTIDFVFVNPDSIWGLMTIQT